MFELKSLHREAIARSLEKAQHYRLLNEPRVTESICNDILAVDPDNQQAIVFLMLAITDQFDIPSPAGIKQAMALTHRVTDEYQRLYCTGIIYERQAKAKLHQNYPDSHYDAYDFLREAMEWFEKAEALENDENDDAVLRWNSCARVIMDQKLKPRPKDDFTPYLE
ncbi:uncharacterized protein METZ01_LOCUS187837 [marine metagenome]|uniref:Uncharacterized protein n=1 Tax=marine metagenome TaxID=408172 RepID=A0A382DBI3_9ZZZZ